MKLENVIYCGDNLIWMKKFSDKCIDLIYLDPPFFLIGIMKLYLMMVKKYVLLKIGGKVE